MSITSQLYELQQLDVELNENEQSASRTSSQLGDSKLVRETRTRLESEQKSLQELNSQQRSLEWEVEGINTKLTKVEGDLYGGRIGNPKELTDLQHEADMLKKQRSLLEDKELGLMEQVEQTTETVKLSDAELNRMVAEWQTRQQRLSADLEQLKIVIADLKSKRETMTPGIDPETLVVYETLKKQRGTAVARVERGLCQGCRISLPVSEMRDVRTGKMVRCSSCGRILFLA